MLNAYPKIKTLGFTLVELIIGVAVIAILMSAAVPSFQNWMLNTQIRNAAESVQNGLIKARGEAIRINNAVTFTLTDPAASDTSWSIDMVVPISGVPQNIETRSGSQGSQKVYRAVLPAGATTVTYNSLGGVIANPPVIVAGVPVVPAAITQVDFAAAGSNQPLRVTITVGGSPKMCNPNLPNTNPRGC